MKLAIIIGVVVILFVVFILASYIKAPTDRALIVSGLRKNPKFVIGKSALRIPFLQRVDKLELKMESKCKMYMLVSDMGNYIWYQHFYSKSRFYRLTI